MERREGVYWSGRVTLAIQPEEISIYDAVFNQHWHLGISTVLEVQDLKPLTLLLDELGETPETGEEEESIAQDAINVRYSRTEILAERRD